MATECAVCYVSDMNFVLPTLVSAVGLRRFVPAHRADVHVFVVDDDTARIDQIERFVKPFGIHVVQMRTDLFSGIGWARSNQTHVPLATLGRFFLDEFLPDACHRIVYLDGDTWIKQDPSALIDMAVPEGKLAAAEDISSFCRRDLTAYGKFVRRYFRGLGIRAESGYFNAGVLAARRTTWRGLAAEAMEFYRNNIEACKYHDQSALNAVIGDRRLWLSLAWNFQTPYRFWDVEEHVDPAIYHFTQGPKPWTATAEPWLEMFAPYQPEVARFSLLDLPIGRTPPADAEAINAWARKHRRRLRYLLPIRLLRRRMMVRKLEAQAKSDARLQHRSVYMAAIAGEPASASIR
jgi:lipopolysaccharide biosynthesis glycosyltransferase